MKYSLISQKEIFSHPLIQKYRDTHQGENFIALTTGDDFIIFHENSEIIAALSYTSDDPYILVSEIKVREEFRHKGYGSKIMNLLFLITQKQKKDVRLRCQNDARGFFTKLKFKPRNDREFEIKFEELDSLTIEIMHFHEIEIKK